MQKEVLLVMDNIFRYVQAGKGLYPTDKKVVLRACRLQRYLTQPMWVTASHTDLEPIVI